MPNPTGRNVHIDRPLTNVSVAYFQQGNWVQDTIFPRLPVAKKSDLYYTYDKDDWLRGQARKRAPGTESAGSGYRLGTDDYHCHVWAFHKDVNDQDRANQDEGINLDREATEFVTRNIMITKENEWASSYFNTGIWGTDLTGVAAAPGAGQFLQFDQAGATPVQQIDADRTQSSRTTGYAPNVFVAGADVHSALKQNQDILDRIRYTQRGVITNDLIASMLEVDKYVVPTAIQDTETEESATENTDFIVSPNDALLVYAAPSPGRLTVSGGYTFVWTGLLGSVSGMQIKRFRMEHLESDRVEGQMAFDQKIVAADVGTFYDNAVPA